MRLLRSLKLIVTANDDGTGIKHFDDEAAIAQTVTGSKKKNTGDLSLTESGGSAPTKQIPFGDVLTAGFAFIQTDRELDLVFNGGTEAIKLKPPSSTQKAVLYWEGSFTSIQATNVDTTAVANVTYTLVGV